MIASAIAITKILHKYPNGGSLRNNLNIRVANCYSIIFQMINVVVVASM